MPDGPTPQEMPYSDRILGGGWSDPAIADPLGDFRAMVDYVSEQSGYKPTTWIMSSAQKEAYEHFTIWFEETKRRLEALPRRRWITRMVLERQLYGRWWKRSRRLNRLRAKIRRWRRGGGWDD